MKIEYKKLNRKTIKLLPEKEWDTSQEYKYVFIIPSGLKHESGYMKITIVGEKDNGDMEVCAYPDDINWDFTEYKQEYDCTGMRTDCFYPNGVLKFWGNRIKFIVGESLSSTPIKIINEKVVKCTITYEI